MKEKMRLTCPNCDAQYEVPEDVIPTEGRDVQCSSCGSTWFQAHPSVAPEPDYGAEAPPPEPEWSPVVDQEPSSPDADFEEAIPTGQESLESVVKQAVRRSIPDEIERVVSDEVVKQAVETEPTETALDFEAALDADLARADDPEADSETARMASPEPEPAEDPEDEIDPVAARRGRTRRKIDPAVVDVLRQEAEHEAEARRAETGSIETQPDLGLGEPDEDDAAKRAREARERMARIRGRSADDHAFSPASPMPANSRRDLLPDIEEINSTLRSTEDRTPEEIPDGRPTMKQRRAGGSRFGFALAILLVAAAFFTYMRPETITGVLPASEGPVTSYVGAVDQGRLWLDGQMTQLMLWLDGISQDPTNGSQDTG